MSHDEMIAVIAAHRDKKFVQWTDQGSNDWITIGEFTDRSLHLLVQCIEAGRDVRIKPDPMQDATYVAMTKRHAPKTRRVE